MPSYASSTLSPQPAEKSTILPEGRMRMSCGYCHGSRSSSVYISPLTLTCADYQAMIDRGWRRSGTNCYKPELKISCCPQYTIRLNALEFQPSKSQRKVINRWNKFVLHGEATDQNKRSNLNKSSTKAAAFSSVPSIHASEKGSLPNDAHPAHVFEVTLEPSSYTDEKYGLSCRYQKHVHNDPFSNHTFRNFLVESCLTPSPIPLSSAAPSHLPRIYGSYHQLYRLDGKLIALAVLDILPGCVSSVYFMYDPQWEKFSFGKLSAMREAVLARELFEHGAVECKYLYMGFYIHSCRKMRYKGDYSPSFLLDPEEYTWFPLTQCVSLLEEYRYACFAHPENSLGDNDDYATPPRPRTPNPEDINAIQLSSGIEGAYSHLTQELLEATYQRKSILEVIESLGWPLAKRMIFKVYIPSFDVGEYDYDDDYDFGEGGTVIDTDNRNLEEGEDKNGDLVHPTRVRWIEF